VSGCGASGTLEGRLPSPLRPEGANGLADAPRSAHGPRPASSLTALLALREVWLTPNPLAPNAAPTPRRSHHHHAGSSQLPTARFRLSGRFHPTGRISSNGQNRPDLRHSRLPHALRHPLPSLDAQQVDLPCQHGHAPCSMVHAAWTILHGFLCISWKLANSSTKSTSAF
jgi:hypothetical protein